MDAEDFTEALMDAQDRRQRDGRTMQRFDLLICPTTAVPAFTLAPRARPRSTGKPVTPTTWQGFTPIANLTGQPAISVPSGTTAAGCPSASS